MLYCVIHTENRNQTKMAIVIPASAAAMANRVNVIPANVVPLTITERYNDEMAFLCLLNRLGLGVKERFRLL